MDLHGKTVVVVGLGVSGLSMTRYAISRGAQVTVNDVRDENVLGEAVEEAKALGAKVELGAHPSALFKSADVVAVSPGVPSLRVVNEAEARGAWIATEVELAAPELQGTVIAITGTNGKSTVTSLVGEIMRATGKPTFVGGNLGTPLLDAVGTPATRKGGVVVVELSSFQLERLKTFRPHVAVLLNVTDDHLDRYESVEAYAQAKARIFSAQRDSDVAVIGAGDIRLPGLVPPVPKLRLFGLRGGDACVRNNAIVEERSGLEFPLHRLKVAGSHNVLNACAAAVTAGNASAPKEAIEHGLATFEGLAHRMQSVDTIDGVTFIDDSKATNVGAAVAALEGVLSDEQLESGRRVVWIAGGVDKGGSYDALLPLLHERARGVVLIGAAAPLIRSAIAPLSLAVRDAGSMHEAVVAARSLAKPGDTVLLAPACSSFDMFASYKDRGDVFQQAARSLRSSA